MWDHNGIMIRRTCGGLILEWKVSYVRRREMSMGTMGRSIVIGDIEQPNPKLAGAH